MILAVPDMALDRARLEPDLTAKYNILLLHGEIEGVLPEVRTRARARIEWRSRSKSWVPRSGTTSRWDTITSTDASLRTRTTRARSIYEHEPVGRAAEERETGIGGKGIIEHDLAKKTHRFHPFPTRPWVDLAPLSGAGLSPVALDEAIRDALDKCDGGIDQKIVRLVVAHVPRHILRELDHKALRGLQTEGAALSSRHARSSATRERSRRARPSRFARRHRARQVALPRAHRNINREQLVELGLHYLREADALAGPADEEASA